MKTHCASKGPCNGCAFHLEGCKFGLSHQPQGMCMEFVPLCLNCQYPSIFCATCSMRRYSNLKPLPREIPQLSRHNYACRW